ncbi:ABC-type multidrug transport system, ATPase and permease component [Mycoplasmopsis canis PG 14]|uniref:ATP-binding cassette domain-containing protein n=1 Tax=Mycoplasmopsis canis TaxID=29555 RepID=UPI00025AD84C|nr:ABC transporter ATP-binding protein [Mycoplasmopsis canis]EIE39900.1 ABC-type multidrug transport system, ATPase and permease component [Mycoplasmopsis canis PG 14]
MKKYFSKKFLLIWISFFYIVSVLSSTFLVFFTTELITKIENEKTNIYIYFVIIALLTVFFILSTISAQLLKNKWNLYINKQLNTDILNKISTESALDIKLNKEGKYLSWIKYRLPEIRQLIFNSLFSISLNFLINIFTIIVLLFVSWKITLIGLFIFIISFLTPLFLSILAGKINQKYNYNQEKIMSSLFNVFKSFRMLYYLSEEEKIINFIDREIDDWIRKINQTKSKVIVLEIISSSFQLFANVIFFFIIGVFIFYYNEPIGIIFVIPGLFIGFGTNLREMIFLIQNLVSYKEYIKEFFKNDKLEISSESIIIDNITIKNLTFNYEHKEIFKNFNFRFEKGKKYAIVAPSGFGKSTFAKILMKQITDYGGTILINNINLNKIENHVLFNSITFLDNSENLFNDTVANNISLWEESDKSYVSKCLINADLHNLDLNFQVDNNNSLSTGQRQKINIARHFYRNNNVLICDEAFSNIDSDSVKKIFNNIDLNDNILFINITHHLNDLSYYDEIINLEERDDYVKDYKEN